MMSADEVAQELNCSKSYAYKLVKAMNKELAAQGYITMAGAEHLWGYLDSYFSSPTDRRILCRQWWTRKRRNPCNCS